MIKLVTLIVLGILGTFGLLSGTALVSDPSGATLSMEVGVSPNRHTWDCQPSGLFVLIIMGIAPLVCVAALLLDVPSALYGAGIIGAVAIVWVSFQIMVLDIEATCAHAVPVLAGIVLILSAIGAEIIR
ncbi:hypothetical protein G352_23686 [Rhodococcus ruber BKS 20-38]|uniref:Integral membrane protein n=1 Tax=Rhodococcus ruber BKS 20-38 TaxID=1278076 RepID=M2Z108_9NOCA|nr:hypothetical protein [Rhodococcus ruber]EME54289.1 hypothetical protein G352_23686 [Rhodococcus ruber BKS 20-38]